MTKLTSSDGGYLPDHLATFRPLRVGIRPRRPAGKQTFERR